VNTVEFHDVSVRLGGQEILSRVSLDIAPGEFIGVLGPNGAGKTTLMRAMLGLIPASRGAIQRSATCHRFAARAVTCG
jgi:zinc/manganese transport system ATP-binding protein